uniref:Zinc finger protein 26 n=1 Tax=Culex pipiens TaxID=7175 RepID=A0A8D8JQ24_CULPI
MNVCRICLCDESEAFDRFLVDIFQQSSEAQNRKFSMPAALQAICGIKLSESDTSPRLVCLECRSRLEEAFNLRQLARRSHETLVAKSFIAEDEAAKVEPEVPEVKLELSDMDAEEEASPDEVLICCGCNFTCVDERELMDHSKQVHFPGAPVDPPRNKALCMVCYSLFASWQILEAHWSGKIGGRVVRICPRCECQFGSKERYEEHTCKGETRDLFRCCGCEFQTEKENKYKWHTKGHRDVERKTRNEELVKSHPIRCSVCAGRFKTKEELTRHREDHRNQTKKRSKVVVEESVDLELACCGCFKVYKTVEEVKEHQQQVHAPEREAASANGSECGNCYKRFSNVSQLKKHTIELRRRFACSKCPAMRNSIQDMLQHLASHDGPKSYWCCGCRLHRERFDTPEELERHSQEIHANQPRFYHKVDNVEEARPFECKTCYRRYPSEMRLRVHMVATYEEESFVCDTCGKAFSRFPAFDTHLALHKEATDYPCPICSKAYKHKRQARGCELRHIKKATAEYVCKICGGKFANSSNLYSHLISHTEATRFSCSICGMRFKRKMGLRSHMVLHGSTRKFACQYCPSRFHTTSALEKHMIQHTGIFPYECDFPGCGQKIRARLKYIQHIESHVDDSERLFGCHLCEQRYSRDHFLSQHLKYAHQIEPQDKSWKAKFNRQSQPGIRRSSVQVGQIEDGEDEEEMTVEYIEQDME